MPNYWAERAALTQEKLTNKSIKETEKQLKKYYSSTLEKILDSFEKVYMKIFHSIQEGREITPADLYRLDNYWKLQAQLNKELEKLGDKQVSLLTQRFIQHYELIYKGLSMEGESFFNTLDKQLAQQMINQVWCADGKSWSQRVWTNLDKLQASLNEGLIHCAIAGKKTTELKKYLMETFNVAYNRADSVVRTEMAHIQTQAAQKRYQDYGIREVEVMAERDESLCDTCKKHDKERYPVNAQMPVPFHPNCRCCVIPVIED